MPFSVVEELQRHSVKINRIEYSTEKIRDVGYLVPELRSILPFRVAFKDLGVSGYSPSNPAPIGIAIIGFNNYIL